jgi:hypothetical protein
MKKPQRRSIAKAARGTPATAAGDLAGAATLDGSSRRAFLQGTAGAAASAAAILAAPKVASIAFDAPGSSVPADPAAVVTKPSGPVPREPVTAYVRDAGRHEVTVLSGRQETTYKDPVLVKRLLDAAR